MATKIVTKNSSTASAVPTASDLVQGELAVNVTDKRLFTENNAGAIVELGTNPTTLNVNGTATMDGLTVQDSTTNAYKAAVIESAHSTTDAGLLFVGGGNYEFGIQQPYNAAGLFFYDRTNGAERMRIDSSGNVKIGDSTTDVTSKLTVSGNASADVATFMYDGAAGTYFDIDCGAADGSVTLKADARTGAYPPLLFNTGGSERMRIDSSGNVGIGTSSPSALLELSANNGSGVANVLRFNDADTGVSAGQTTGRIEFAENDGGNTTVSAFLEVDTVGTSGGGVMTFGTGSAGATPAERMRIDSAGNLLLGTTSANGKLTLNSGGPLMASYKSEDTNGGYIYFGSAGGGQGYMGSNYHLISGTPSDDYFAIRAENGLDFAIGSSRVGRFDASGNLLIGKTTTGVAGAGTVIRAGGEIFVTRAGDVMNLNRLSTDGEIMAFRKDGAYVGGIGSRLGDGLTINSNGNTDGLLKNNGAESFGWNSSYFYSRTDNSRDLGLNVLRWNDIYATNGTIQTSDRNEKQDIEELSDAEQRVAVAAKGLLRKFRWKDSVAEKGDEARVHFGIIAQDLQAAFAAEGLDAGDYAMFISTTWTDEETNEEKTRMGVRYSELLAFIIAAL